MQVFSRTLAEVEMAGVRAVHNMATLRLRAHDTNDIRSQEASRLRLGHTFNDSMNEYTYMLSFVSRVSSAIRQ